MGGERGERCVSCAPVLIHVNGHFVVCEPLDEELNSLSTREMNGATVLDMTEWAGVQLPSEGRSVSTRQVGHCENIELRSLHCMYLEQDEALLPPQIPPLHRPPQSTNVLTGPPPGPSTAHPVRAQQPTALDQNLHVDEWF